MRSARGFASGNVAQISAWPTHVQSFLRAFNIRVPIVQAPMAGSDSPQLAVAVSTSGGLGSLAGAMLSASDLRSNVTTILNSTRIVNLNFFCHRIPVEDPLQIQKWRAALQPFYDELACQDSEAALRLPFDESSCKIVEELRPPVVSFHFGLPRQDLFERVKATGAKILCSATTVDEALFLVKHGGVDAIIAQGYEAGGHRGTFLSHDMALQVGTMSLVPLIVQTVIRHSRSIPVIAAGGIGDAAGVAAAMRLGASAVQLGTAYLFCPEANISALYRSALRQSHDTVVTNVFSGRPARGIVNHFISKIGPLSPLAPPFPLASRAVASLRKTSESRGSTDFMQMWCGQGAALCREAPAGKLTEDIAVETLRLLKT